MDEAAKQAGEEINLDDEIEKAERKEGKTKFISEEKALQEIERLFHDGASEDTIIRSLAGFDSKIAWDLRGRLLKKEVGADLLLESLAGMDSPAAFDERNY